MKFTTMADETPKPRTLVLARKEEYVKNPISLIDLLGPLSLAQQRIVMEILTKVQPHIKRYLDHLEERKENEQYQLFSDSDFEDNKISFEMPLSEVCHQASEYKELSSAAMMMSSIMAPAVKEDKHGNLVQSVRPLMTCWLPVAGKSQRRVGYMTVEIERSVADATFNMQRGFAEHIKRIVYMCKCSRTPVLYEYLTKKFMKDDTCEVSYEELRKLLGARTEVLEDTNTVDKEGEKIYNKVVTEKYTQYKDFKRRILEPVKKELDEFWYTRQGTDFTINYEPVYSPYGKGRPKAIRFMMVVDRPEAPSDENISPEVQKAIDLWAKFKNLAVKRVGLEQVEQWLKPAEIVSVSAKEVVFRVPSKTFATDFWVPNIYQPCLEDWNAVFGAALPHPVVE